MPQPTQSEVIESQRLVGASVLAPSPATDSSAQPTHQSVQSIPVGTPEQGSDTHQFAQLADALSILSRDIPLAETLNHLAREARTLLRCESTAVCLLSDGRNQLDFAAVAGTGSAEMTGQRVRVDDALPGPTALSGKPLLAFNEHADTNVTAQTDSFAQAGVRSAAVVPIMVNETSIGSIAAIDRAGNSRFTGSDILMLKVFASIASAAIQRDHMARVASQRERERNILFQIAQNASSSLDTQKILDITLETLAGNINLSSGIIFLFNDDRSILYIASSVGLTDDELELQISAESSFASAVLLDGGSALILHEPANQIQYADVFPPSVMSPQCAMAAPLITRDGVAGILVTTSRERNAYSQDDLALLAAVASHTAVKVDNALLYEDATRRASEATSVYELSQTLNTSLSADHIAKIAVDAIAPLLRVDRCALFLYNPLKSQLEIKAARGLSGDVVDRYHPCPERRGIAWWVYEFETPTAVLDVAADHRNRSFPIEQEGIASLLSVPLQSGDKVIGVIHAMSSRRRSFTVGEMELLYTVGNQVGAAIEKTLILEETRRQGSDLRRSFRRVTRALGASTTPAQTAEVITELAAELLRVDRAVLYVASEIISHDTPSLTPVASYGFKLPELLSSRGDDGLETTAQAVARRRKVVMIEEGAINDPKFRPSEILASKVSHASFYMGLPLKIGNEIVGVIEVYAREPRKVSRADMRNILAFASQAAIALRTSTLG